MEIYYQDSTFYSERIDIHWISISYTLELEQMKSVVKQPYPLPIGLGFSILLANRFTIFLMPFTPLIVSNHM
jgi:hypothetical protein